MSAVLPSQTKSDRAEALRRKQTRAIQLKAGGLSLAEIAERLGATARTVKRWLAVAR